ncbi:MAG: SLATT domain-containing protein [Nitrospira sp.]|nr:SLATT domain-containing protein [Nitrospira sp.]
MSSAASVLDEWKQRISRSHRAHKKAAAFYEAWSRRLGIIAAVLSAIVGTTVFSTLEEASLHIAIKVILGLFSVAAAVFAALQTYLKLPELAQNHSKAATDFGDLRRRIERLEANPPTSEKLDVALAALDEEWRAISERAPIITQKIYEQVERQAAQQVAPGDAKERRA